MFGSVDIGSGGGSSVGSSVDNGGSLGDVGDSSIGNMVGVGHHGGGNRLLDDWLALDWDGEGGIVRSINMDRDGNLDKVVGVKRSIIRDVNWTLNEDGSLDVVDLDLLVNDGSVHSVGSLEDSWDLDGEIRGGRLEDPGVVSGNIAALSIVDLLGDDGGRLVDGGGSRALSNGGVGGRGSGLGISLVNGLDRSVRDEAVSCGGRATAVGHSTSGVGSSSIGRCSKEGKGRGPAHCGQDKGKCHKRSHFDCIFH